MQLFILLTESAVEFVVQRLKKVINTIDLKLRFFIGIPPFVEWY